MKTQKFFEEHSLATPYRTAYNIYETRCVKGMWLSSYDLLTIVGPGGTGPCHKSAPSPHGFLPVYRVRVGYLREDPAATQNSGLA
jgi:hypothetical protein